MSYKLGVSLAVKCVRSANYCAGSRLLSTEGDTSKGQKWTSEIDKNAFSLSRRNPEPLPQRYEDIGRVQKPSKPAAAVEGAVDECSQISGVPEEHVVNRRARIYAPARVATQSGTNNTTTWKIELDNRERWENPLMGWSSTGDPISNVSMAMAFASKEDAIQFCLRQGWEYEVEEKQEQKVKPKTYGSNFSWSKRTRVTTK